MCAGVVGYARDVRAFIALLLFAAAWEKDPRVATVREHVKAIDGAKLSKRVKSVDGCADGGSDLTILSDSSGPRKATFEVLGEMGRTKLTYYFTDGKPDFAFAVDERYDSTYSGHVVRKTETRFYFADGKPFLTLNGTKPVTKKDDEVKLDPSAQSVFAVATSKAESGQCEEGELVDAKGPP